MPAMSTYLENKVVDHIYRGVAYTAPAGLWAALIRATAGQSPRSTAVTLNQTTIPAAPNGRMYKCSTAGTTGAGEPTWPTTSGGTVTDGTAVWTEMSPDFEQNTTAVTNAEVTTTTSGYSRASLAPSTTNWAATNADGSTTNPSSGTSGKTSNNSTLSFGPSSGANAAWGVIGGAQVYDASSAGNAIFGGGVTQAQTVSGAGGTVSFAAAALSFTFVN